MDMYLKVILPRWKDPKYFQDPYQIYLLFSIHQSTYNF